MTHLLVVEDTPESSYLLVTLLRGHGYAVESAVNGREALDKARAAPPQLVISDILMPVMDGFTLCRQWMQDPQLRQIPFIFYSATYTDAQDIQFGLGLGARRFIRKPADSVEFVQTVERVLAEYAGGELPVAQPTVAEEPVYLKVYNERLVKRLEHKMLEVEAANRRLATLLRVSSDLSLLRPQRDLIQLALATITAAMGYTRAYYFAFDPQEQTFHYLLAVGTVNEESQRIRRAMTIRLGEERGLVGLVGQQGIPLVVADTRAEPRWVRADPTIRSAMLLPVIHDDMLLGVCTFVSDQPNAFASEDVDNATILANNMAIALENVRLYEEQQNYAAHLEEVVAQRTAELEVALERAQAADRLKSQFVADINHELRTPLTSIGLYLHLLPRVDAPKRNEIIEVMQRETTLLKEMIEDLLDLSRLDLDKTEIQMEPILLDQLVEILETDRRHLAEAKGLTLVVQSATAMQPVYGDQKLIY